LKPAKAKLSIQFVNFDVMLSKDRILQTVKDLPENFSIEELFERIILLQKIEVGLEQSKTDQVLTTSQARERLKRWLLK
jgi:hypothetical protein